jgi:serine/threonine protein kinase/tetratricopeptide (TPR) repeat protein
VGEEGKETLLLDTPEPWKSRFGPDSVLKSRYRLNSEIGRGGMGVVYRATDIELHRDVAIKILPERVSAPDARERFLREARAAAALNHPNIVSIYDVGEEFGVPFFVMELVEGRSLGQELTFSAQGSEPSVQRSAFSVQGSGASDDHSIGKTIQFEFAEVVDIACQICAALEHAHTHNIVHRDLKPDNVLLTASGQLGSTRQSEITRKSESTRLVESTRKSGSARQSGTPVEAGSTRDSGSVRQSGTVKLADLGLALPVRDSRLSGAGAIVGTPAYMAPEQILGQKIDGRADLYALGVLIYEMTTRRLPFTGDDPLAVVSQHVHAPVVPPRNLRPDIPRALEAVILRLLAKDPEQRYATAAEVSVALREALETPDVEAEGAEAAVTILDALSRGRLVGRGDELAEARQLWQRAREGKGHCLLLSGEPGAGKTRLAREVIVQAALDGAPILRGGCYEYEATTPYLPFVEAVRRWVREQSHAGKAGEETGDANAREHTSDAKVHEQSDDAKLKELLGDAAAQLSKLAPEIETRIGPFPPRPSLPPHEERLLFFDAVAQFFVKLAERRGLLFFADDLHWADSSTVWLIGHLLRNIRSARVLIVGCYREIELDRTSPLAKALVDWNRERLMTRLVLRRFGAEETREQLSALLNERVSTDFANAVYSETEGNPFFVEEVLKSLIEQGSVRRKSGAWTREEVADLVIPQSVKEAIGSRLDRVSPSCNEILRAAAVLGKKFSFEELSTAVGDQNEETLLDALDEATTAQLLVAERGDAFAFTHDKIREVLYEELNPIRRRRLHKRTAEGLERHRDRASVAVETLAHHFIEAGELERGFDYAKQAGESAEKIFAFEEAIAAYGRALECAESLGLQNELIALEEKIGNLSSVSGNQIAAFEHFERALTIAQDPLQRARLQCEAASALVINGDARGVELLHEALTVLDPGANPIETANALMVEGRFHHLAGRHRKAAELIEKAAALAEPRTEGTLSVFHASTLSTLYPYLAGAYQHMGRFADSNRWSQRAIEFGRKYQVPFAEALGNEFFGENSVHTGEWRKGLEYAGRERELATRLHSRERLAWTGMYEGFCAWMLGEFELAERVFDESIALAEAVGDRRLTNLLSSYRAGLLADMGRLDEALEAGRKSFEVAEASGLLFMRTEAHRCLAIVQFRRGELNEVVALSERIFELTANTDARVSRLWVGPLYIEALVVLGRNEEARERLAAYKEMVAECQAPQFSEKEKRIESLIQ